MWCSHLSISVYGFSWCFVVECRERKNSESEKSKVYDIRRYSESESHEKDDRGRSYDELDKFRHYGNATSRLPYPSFPESDNQERKRSREETIYEMSKVCKRGNSIYIYIE